MNRRFLVQTPLGSLSGLGNQCCYKIPSDFQVEIWINGVINIGQVTLSPQKRLKVGYGVAKEYIKSSTIFLDLLFFSIAFVCYYFLFYHRKPLKILKNCFYFTLSKFWNSHPCPKLDAFRRKLGMKKLGHLKMAYINYQLQFLENLQNVFQSLN